MRRQRIEGPRAELYNLYKNVRRLATLTHRSVFYERWEVLDAQGQVLERSARGSPFVWRKDLGVVPVDPEDSGLDDGSSVLQETRGCSDERGRWHRIVRYVRLPPPQRKQAERGAPRGPSAHTQRSSKPQSLSQLLVGSYDPVPVVLELRDQEELPRAPSRVVTGLAFTEHGRSDRLTPLRTRIREANRRKRTAWARPLRAWLRSIGARVDFHLTTHANLLYVRVPRRHLTDLVGRAEVVGIERHSGREVEEETLEESYLCTGAPMRSNVYKDHEECATHAFYPPWAYLDGVNAATGVLQYINAGYDGMISGGNAPWAWFSTNEETLSLGVRDYWIHTVHPAFEYNGDSRFLYLFYEIKDGVVRIASRDEVETRPKPDDADSHGTGASAVAMASVMLGQDPDLTTTITQAARSGIARMVAGLGSVQDVQLPDMLETIASDFGTSSRGEPCGGLDVLTHSLSANEGEHIPGSKYNCPTEDQARGLDSTSQLFSTYFREEGLLYVKAAGNMGGVDVGTSCASASSVSAPGAAPAALPVGAIATSDLAPIDMQNAPDLRSDSSVARTPDGRAYPLLVTAGYQCGTASMEGAYYAGSEFTYGRMGATSGTAPRVAGSALLFKHYDLDQHGSVANAPGRTLVGMLNFADGFALDTSLAGDPRGVPPLPGWGLGRLRMRLYASGGLGGVGDSGIESFRLHDGECVSFDLGTLRGTVPSAVRRIRITAWWLEVNTGVDEEKAEIHMGIIGYATTTRSLFLDVVTNGSDHVLRLEYDRTDSALGCPPGGQPVTLFFWAPHVPADERYPERDDYRTLYVSWFWETGSDPSKIDCGDSVTDYCGGLSSLDLTMVTEGPVARGSYPIGDLARAASRSVVRGLRVACGLSGAGTSPVRPSAVAP